MGYGTAAQNAILTDEGFTAQEAAKSQQIVTRLTLKKKRKEKTKKKRWRTSAVEAEEIARGTWHFGNRMDRQRGDVAETAAVVETGRRSIAQ